MKVKLLKRQKEGEAGEIVDVSPVRADFFFSVEVAEPVKEAREQAAKPEPKTVSEAEQAKKPKTVAKKK